ncbi:hypothetical protein KFE25_003835 [Diacronema lutheri]|uniref:J domain-containing protein n=2 Tax=Diacronema lutheri TaxID=2081491 RepID=A0A8J5XL47_DIALT|nr:hypothetical protein KFE25_003835 [Diacronema lutheri]
MATPRLRAKNGQTQCYYESLGVERTASDDELKQAYRKLALQWHPDKNQDNIDEATEVFKVIQNAYSVLSDPNERSWYDRHREQILRGAGPGDADSDDDDIDLFPFFSASAYKGWGDDEDGFYAVYADVFADIDALEREQGEDDEDAPARGARSRNSAAREPAPGFGASNSPWANVRDFYNHWTGFFTRRPLYAHDKWDLREASNRFVRRAMEKENMKERTGARREYSAQVRELVEFVRKRDKRVAAHNEKVDAETREREAALRARREEEQRAYDAERSRLAAELAAEDDEELLLQLQAAAADLGLANGGKKGRRGKKGGASAHDGGGGSGGGGGGDGGGGGAPQGDASADADADADAQILYCPACNKDFRSRAQWQNHERSKRHIEKAAELRELLREEDEGEESDEDIDEDDGEDGSEAAAEAQRAEGTASAAGSMGDTYGGGEDEDGVESDDGASALATSARRKPTRRAPRAREAGGGDDGDDDDDVDVDAAQLFAHVSMRGSRRAGPLAGLPADPAPRAPSTNDADATAADRAPSAAESSAAPANGRAKPRRRAKRAEGGPPAGPAPPPPAPSARPESPVGGGARGSRRQRRGKAAPDGAEKDFECKSCGQQFSTRNRLFQHIKTDCHPAQLAALRKQ